VSGESQCWDGVLNEYKEKCLEALDGVDWFSIAYIPRGENHKANMLTQQASGYDIKRGLFRSRKEPMICDALVVQGSSDAPANENGSGEEDWRHALTEYNRDPNCSRDCKTRQQTLKYILVDGVLHRRMVEGLLLKCFGKEEVKIAMGEVHEGLCGAHQSAHKMRWMLRRVGVYWLTILRDCFMNSKQILVSLRNDRGA
jgi:hypothetical protein